MIDRTTKVILAAIALGLWANAIIPLARATPAQAQNDQYLVSVQHDLHAIYYGICLNRKIC